MQHSRGPQKKKQVDAQVLKYNCAPAPTHQIDIEHDRPPHHPDIHRQGSRYRSHTGVPSKNPTKAQPAVRPLSRHHRPITSSLPPVHSCVGRSGREQASNGPEDRKPNRVSQPGGAGRGDERPGLVTHRCIAGLAPLLRTSHPCHELHCAVTGTLRSSSFSGSRSPASIGSVGVTCPLTTRKKNRTDKKNRDWVHASNQKHFCLCGCLGCSVSLGTRLASEGGKVLMPSSPR